MSTSVLPFSSGHPIPSVVNTWLLMDICFFNGRFLLQQILTFIEVVLRSHAALGSCHSLPAAALASCGPSAVGGVRIVKVIKVIEHQVHVLLLLSLQVVDDSLVFVNFYPDVRICLP